ncbi:MAG: hypothetical protein KC656_34005, partial [Myxococcales bacterium]|nr:hypothetical protein [Myxococcales bacterium]
TVDDFRVRLWDRTHAVLDGTGHVLTIPPGTVWFAVSAKAEGTMGVVAATNETALVLTREDGAWSASGFTLAYQDGSGEYWALVVTPTRWQ